MEQPDLNRECFACRIMRSFAFSGIGAVGGGYGALWLGAPRTEAVYWAVGGALLALAALGQIGRLRVKNGPI